MTQLIEATTQTLLTQNQVKMIRVLDPFDMASAVEKIQHSNIDYEQDERAKGAKVIYLERMTDIGYVSIAIDTHGGQIISHQVNGTEFISPDGPRGTIYNVDDTERGRWPQNSPNTSIDPEGFWPFHGIINRINGTILSTDEDFQKGQATIAFTGRQIKEALIKHYEVVSSLPSDSKAKSAEAKRMPVNEFEARLDKIDDASGIFLNFDIDDDGGIIVTQQMVGIGEAAPGMHPYFNLFGITSLEALKMQAHLFGKHPDEITPEKLKHAITIPLHEAMKFAQENGEDTISFYLDPEGYTKIELTPMEGFGKDAEVAIFSDSDDRICIELLNSGFRALGTGRDTLNTNWFGATFSTKVRALLR